MEYCSKSAIVAEINNYLQTESLCWFIKAVFPARVTSLVPLNNWTSEQNLHNFMGRTLYYEPR